MIMATEIIYRQTTFANIACDLNQINVFSFQVDENYDSTETTYNGVLSNNELDRSKCFRQLRDRSSFLVRRYYLRMLLSKLLSQPTNEIEFKTCSNKKPIVQGLEFNTSHSGNCAVIVVSPAPVGIDIEEVDPSFDFGKIVECCFGGEEQKLLKTAEPIQAFFRLWTRKEAILKATGEGIVNDMHLLNSLPDRVYRNGMEYETTTFNTNAKYVVSIASSMSTSSIHFWQIGPNTH